MIREAAQSLAHGIGGIVRWHNPANAEESQHFLDAVELV